MQVKVIISGRNYHTLGSIPARLDLPEGCTLHDAIQTAAAALPAGVSLPEACLVAVSGKHLGTLHSHLPCVLKEGDELLLIAPVAGG